MGQATLEDLQSRLEEIKDPNMRKRFMASYIGNRTLDKDSVSFLLQMLGSEFGKEAIDNLIFGQKNLPYYSKRIDKIHPDALDWKGFWQDYHQRIYSTGQSCYNFIHAGIHKEYPDIGKKIAELCDERTYFDYELDIDYPELIVKKLSLYRSDPGAFFKLESSPSSSNPAPKFRVKDLAKSLISPTRIPFGGDPGDILRYGLLDLYPDVVSGFISQLINEMKNSRKWQSSNRSLLSGIVNSKAYLNHQDIISEEDLIELLSQRAEGYFGTMAGRSLVSLLDIIFMDHKRHLEKPEAYQGLLDWYLKGKVWKTTWGNKKRIEGGASKTLERLGGSKFLDFLHSDKSIAENFAKHILNSQSSSGWALMMDVAPGMLERHVQELKPEYGYIPNEIYVSGAYKELPNDFVREDLLLKEKEVNERSAERQRSGRRPRSPGQFWIKTPGLEKDYPEIVNRVVRKGMLRNPSRWFNEGDVLYRFPDITIEAAKLVRETKGEEVLKGLLDFSGLSRKPLAGL